MRSASRPGRQRSTVEFPPPLIVGDASGGTVKGKAAPIFRAMKDFPGAALRPQRTRTPSALLNEDAATVRVGSEVLASQVLAFRSRTRSTDASVSTSSVIGLS